MIETCPLCGHKLIIGKDSEKKIKYDPEDVAKFQNGKITLEELTTLAKIYFTRTMLCSFSGNENTLVGGDGKEFTLNPPCQNYYGRDGGTIDNPHAVVEVVTIEDN